MTETKVKLIKTKDWSGKEVVSGGIVNYKTEDGKRIVIGLNFSQEGLTRSSSSSTDYSYVQAKVKIKNYIFSKTLLNEKYQVGEDTWRPGGNSTSSGCQSFDQFLKSKINALERSLERSEYANLVPFVKQARADILAASINDREKTKNKEQRDEEVFNNTYKNSGPKFIETYRGFDVEYPKGSMCYMSPEQLSAPTISVNDRIQTYKERISQLETPIYRVIGNAICDYIAQNSTNTIEMELEINNLLGTDKNPLSVDGDNYKSKKLRELLSEKIIGSKGEVINPQALVNSNFLKDYKGYGVDLTKTETIQKISKPVNNTRNNTDERL